MEMNDTADRRCAVRERLAGRAARVPALDFDFGAWSQIVAVQAAVSRDMSRVKRRRQLAGHLHAVVVVRQVFGSLVVCQARLGGYRCRQAFRTHTEYHQDRPS